MGGSGEDPSVPADPSPAVSRRRGGAPSSGASTRAVRRPGASRTDEDERGAAADGAVIDGSPARTVACRATAGTLRRRGRRTWSARASPDRDRAMVPAAPVPRGVDGPPARRRRPCRSRRSGPGPRRASRGERIRRRRTRTARSAARRRRQMPNVSMDGTFATTRPARPSVVRPTASGRVNGRAGIRWRPPGDATGRSELDGHPRGSAEVARPDRSRQGSRGDDEVIEVAHAARRRRRRRRATRRRGRGRPPRGSIKAGGDERRVMGGVVGGGVVISHPRRAVASSGSAATAVSRAASAAVSRKSRVRAGTASSTFARLRARGRRAARRRRGTRRRPPRARRHPGSRSSSEGRDPLQVVAVVRRSRVSHGTAPSVPRAGPAAPGGRGGCATSRCRARRPSSRRSRRSRSPRHRTARSPSAGRR